MNEKSTEDYLLDILKGRRHPNCTLYLIWHYVSRGDMECARAEFIRDSDKLGSDRGAVKKLLGI